MGKGFTREEENLYVVSIFFFFFFFLDSGQRYRWWTPDPKTLVIGRFLVLLCHTKMTFWAVLGRHTTGTSTCRNG